MAQSVTTFSSIRDELARQLRKRLEYVDGKQDAPYAPTGTARDVFSGEKDVLRLLFAAVENHLEPEYEAEAFVARLCSREESTTIPFLCGTFAILLCNGMSLADFCQFMKHCFPASPVLSDRDLPWDRTCWTSLFPEKGELFHRAQYVWCPIRLERGKTVDYSGIRKQSCPLPRLRSKVIGQGSSSCVSEVEFTPDHGPFDDGHGRLYAQKDLTIDDNVRRAFDEEWRVLKSILSGRRQHRNICSAVAALIWTQNTVMTCSIFSPLATCDLRRFLYPAQDHLETRREGLETTDRVAMEPLNAKSKSGILDQGIDLVDALAYLHRDLDLGSDEAISCWHLDLKASNILVFFNYAGEEGKVLFQISDFGLSRLKTIRNSRSRHFSGVQSLSDGRTVHDNFGSSTTARAGDASECLSPEAYDGSRINQSSDVWSLGCILGLLLTYTEGGSHLVQSFVGRRRCHPDYGDWFFTMERDQDHAPSNSLLHFDRRQRAVFRRKTAVDDWLHLLTCDSDPGAKRMKQGFVAILLDHMLVPSPGKRSSARKIFGLLKTTVRRPSAGSETPSSTVSSDVLQTGYSGGTHAQSGPRPARRPVIGHAPPPSGGDTLHINGGSAMAGSERENIRRLFLMASSGNVNCLQEILQSRAPYEGALYDENGMSPISLAAEKGHVEAVKVLLDHGHTALGIDGSGKHAIHRAAEQGHAFVVKVLLERGQADVNCRSVRHHSWTPLHWAAMYGHSQVIDVLLEADGIDIDSVDANGRTALSWACGNRRISAVKALLKSKAVDPLKMDNYGKSPKLRAKENNCGEILLLLRAYEVPRSIRKLVSLGRVR